MNTTKKEKCRALRATLELVRERAAVQGIDKSIAIQKGAALNV